MEILLDILRVSFVRFAGGSLIFSIICGGLTSNKGASLKSSAVLSIPGLRRVASAFAWLSGRATSCWFSLQSIKHLPAMINLRHVFLGACPRLSGFQNNPLMGWHPG